MYSTEEIIPISIDFQIRVPNSEKSDYYFYKLDIKSNIENLDIRRYICSAKTNVDKSYPIYQIESPFKNYIYENITSSRYAMYINIKPFDEFLKDNSLVSHIGIYSSLHQNKYLTIKDKKPLLKTGDISFFRVYILLRKVNFLNKVDITDEVNNLKVSIP